MSSGTCRRGDFCVLNEIPSARASLELRFGVPSQRLRVHFPGDPIVGSAISSFHRNLVSWGQLRQLVSPPPQLRLACYQFRCESGLCGFSGTPLYLSAVQVIEANSLEVPASLEETQ
ncbi:putative formin-like protein 18 isoform X1 [Iris pallida]|uniref:Formin-like protein 18 isoform X1 n=1 Tax=Iris pallida TaxID=29817 RepID=A0AAX6EHH5_IRIPA|nr:putative formin-like protein 18 isoform X1 [Iris pallida]